MTVALIRLSNLAIVVMWVGLALYWWAAALVAKKNVGINWRGLTMRVISAVAIVILMRLHLIHLRRHALLSISPTTLIAHLLGVALCATGVFFAVWARRHLGRNWGLPMSVKAEPEMVTSGPYRLVRHPIYAGILLAMFGAALVIGAWLFLVFLIMAACTGWYIASEERQLLDQFPSEYPAYQQRTKMLIPYIL